MKKNISITITILLIIAIILAINNKQGLEKEIYIYPSISKDKNKVDSVFTDEELKWIDSNKDKYFIVGIAKDYIPIEYLDEQRNPKGIGIEVLKKVSDFTRLKFKVYEDIEKNNWGDTIECFKDRKIDILPAVSFTEERESYMIFSDPYIETTLVILGHKNNYKVINGINNIENETIAIPRGYWIIETVKNQNPKADIVLVDNMQQALKSVNNKKADYAICEIPIFTYYKEQDLFMNLKIMGEVGEKNCIRLGVKKEYKNLVSIINKTISNINRDEIYEKALVIPKTNNKEKRMFTIIVLLLLALSIVIYHLYKVFHALVIEKKKAEEANLDKARLMTNISHDLRTPVTVILGYADAIIEGEVKSKDDIEKYICRIQFRTRHLNILINDFFLLSKLEDNKLTFTKRVVDINELILNIVENMEINFLAKNIRIQMNLDKNIQSNKLIDIYRMNQAIENIISNAIKYVQNGGEIKIGTRLCKENKVEIYIQDNGCGIEKEDLPYIFDRYYKIVKKGQKEESTGLGLCIAKEIVEKHDGQIWVESESNKGSRFYILL